LSGLSQGGVDGEQSLIGAHVLGVDGENRFKLLLGDQEISFIAGFKGLGKEQRLAGGGVAVLGDERAGGEGEGESCPGVLLRVDFFHVGCF
jgi:hypothetical protein